MLVRLATRSQALVTYLRCQNQTPEARGPCDPRVSRTCDDQARLENDHNGASCPSLLGFLDPRVVIDRRESRTSKPPHPISCALNSSMTNALFSFEACDVFRRCLTTHCIMAEIALHLDGHDLVQLSRASKWMYFSLWGSPSIWKKALRRVGVDIDLSFTPFRTLYILSILSFTNDCMLCGASTANGILGEGEAATRLCNRCAANVLIPAPDADQPPELRQNFYDRGPHRYFKMILRRGVSRARIPALLWHAKPATLYKALPSAPNDPGYMAGNRYLQQLMNDDREERQPGVPVRSLKISTIGQPPPMDGFGRPMVTSSSECCEALPKMFNGWGLPRSTTNQSRAIH
ncbi:hypothetical protein OPQ81_001078 [Rhizoctonia solani]|nr:hypothetical protein OPQ81_001078 [Rhizoctonia solani]